MRIAMVSHSYYPHDVRIRRECEALADAGIEVDLVCLRQESEASAERIGNVRVHRMPVRHRRGQGPLGYLAEYAAFFLLAAARLTVLYARARHPVVQVHNLPDFLVFSAFVPKVLGARVLLDMHDVTPELFQSLYGVPARSPLFSLLVLVERAALAYADAVITVNRRIRDLFLSRNAASGKIEVVMNAPDPRYFTPGSGARSPNGRFRLLHHGQLLRRYSLETAIEAVRIARDELPGLLLDIYGDGEEAYIGELRSRVAESGVEDAVRFHDRVPVERVPALIAGADLGLVPCRRDPFVDKVMLPVRLLEYVVMGLPAVVSRVGTVEAYFGDDAVAYCRPEDPEALARAIVDLARRPEKRAAMASRARAAFRPCEWPVSRARYIRLVEDLAR